MEEQQYFPKLRQIRIKHLIDSSIQCWNIDFNIAWRADRLTDVVTIAIIAQRLRIANCYAKVVCCWKMKLAVVYIVENVRKIRFHPKVRHDARSSIYAIRQIFWFPRWKFLQRVSIACYAERCISYSKSVRLSVTRWHWVKTTQATIMGSSLEDSPMTSF